MASEQMRTLLEMRRKAPRRDQRPTVEQERAGAEMALSDQPVPDNVDIVDLEVAGRPARRYLAKGARTDRAILYFHGGGYAMGPLDTHNSLMAHLSVARNAIVLGLDYRLAPEHPYPAAVEDAVDAFEILAARIPADHVMIAGDSAGGGLTLACMLALRDKGLPMPGCAALLSPWTDLTGSGDSMRTQAKRSFLETAAQYAGERPLDTPGVSPLFGELKGLPPLLIQIVATEDLFDDSTRLEGRARTAGVPVDIVVFDEAFHVFQLFASLPEAQEAVSGIGKFFDRIIG